MKTKAVFIFLFFLLTISLFAFKIPNVNASTTITLYPSGDSHVYRYYPNNNYGTSYLRHTKSSSSSYYARSLAIFDVSEDYIGVGNSVVNATYRLYFYAVYVISEISAHKINEEWAEMTVTWNNQPDHEVTATDSQLCSAVGWLEFDVTDDVQDIFNGDENWGWKTKFTSEVHSSTKSCNARQRESAPDPELVIVYTGGMYITFYNQVNSVFLSDGVTHLNGTSYPYLNNSITELQGIINISTQFIEFDWTTGNAEINPYNYTVTGNISIWLIVSSVEGNGNGYVPPVAVFPLTETVFVLDIFILCLSLIGLFYPLTSWLSLILSLFCLIPMPNFTGLNASFIRTFTIGTVALSVIMFLIGVTRRLTE